MVACQPQGSPAYGSPPALLGAASPLSGRSQVPGRLRKRESDDQHFTHGRRLLGSRVRRGEDIPPGVAPAAFGGGLAGTERGCGPLREQSIGASSPSPLSHHSSLSHLAQRKDSDNWGGERVRPTVAFDRGGRALAAEPFPGVGDLQFLAANPAGTRRRS